MPDSLTLTELASFLYMSGIIIAIVEAVKRAFHLEPRFIPLLSVVLGVTLSLVVSFGLGTVSTAEGAVTASLLGVIYGALASGIWSQTNAIVRND